MDPTIGGNRRLARILSAGGVEFSNRAGRGRNQAQAATSPATGRDGERVAGKVDDVLADEVECSGRLAGNQQPHDLDVLLFPHRRRAAQLDGSLR